MSDTETARASITALRDAARQSTMDFRERDRHVSTLHRALDALATAQAERDAAQQEAATLKEKVWVLEAVGVVLSSERNVYEREVARLQQEREPKEDH